MLYRQCFSILYAFFSLTYAASLLPSRLIDRSQPVPGDTSVKCKKGTGVWVVTKVKACWGYDWTDSPDKAFSDWGQQPPADVDIVAMVQKQSNIAQLGSSRYKTILGYNEPDVGTSDQYAVQSAINNWPALVATGKRIGSPAPGAPPFMFRDGSWFDTFFKGIAAKGSHVDFIALHHYTTDGDVNKFRELIESVHNATNKPIWVTEWAWQDFSKPPGAGRFPSTDKQVQFMIDAAAMLEASPFVERYSWCGSPDKEMNLFDKDNKITPMGVAYTNL